MACCFYPRPVSRVSSAALLAPHYGFEALYVLSEPSESTRPRFHLYLQVDEILADVRDHADTLAKTSKPLYAILPRRRRSHSVADVTDLTTPVALIPISRVFQRTSRCRPSERAPSPSLRWNVWRAPCTLLWKPIPTRFGFSRVSCCSSSGMVSPHPTLRCSIRPFLPCLLACRGRHGRLLH